jgi:hypothetical protein
VYAFAFCHSYTPNGFRSFCVDLYKGCIVQRLVALDNDGIETGLKKEKRGADVLSSLYKTFRYILSLVFYNSPTTQT